MGTLTKKRGACPLDRMTWTRRTKVQVESADYAQREYGATDEQISAFAQATDNRFQKLNRTGELTLTNQDGLRKLLEEAARD